MKLLLRMNSAKLIVALFLPACHGAAVGIDLTPATLTGLPGVTLTFGGVLTNTTGSTLFLNSAEINLAGGFDPSDTDPGLFLINAPPTLDGAALTPSMDLFSIHIPDLLASGSYQGTFVVLGGADGSSQDILGSALFSVQVDAATATPEPGVTMLVAGGLLLLAGYSRSRVEKHLR